MYVVNVKTESGNKEVDIPISENGIEVFGPDKDGNVRLVVKDAKSSQHATEKADTLLRCIFVNSAEIVGCQEVY